MDPGTSISDGIIRVHYGSSPRPALPDPFPSTRNERTGLRAQLLALADQVDAVMALWGQTRLAVAEHLGIATDEFMARMPEILSERSTINEKATARYEGECRSAVIQAYGHARSIGLADAEMEGLWRTRIGAGAAAVPAILRRIAARVPE